MRCECVCDSRQKEKDLLFHTEAIPAIGATDATTNLSISLEEGRPAHWTVYSLNHSLDGRGLRRFLECIRESKEQRERAQEQGKQQGKQELLRKQVKRQDKNK
eukprot:COSAG01_NODE_23988_length_794_cov_5.706475_1_plen_102_part_10